MSANSYRHEEVWPLAVLTHLRSNKPRQPPEIYFEVISPLPSLLPLPFPFSFSPFSLNSSWMVWEALAPAENAFLCIHVHVGLVGNASCGYIDSLEKVNTGVNTEVTPNLIHFSCETLPFSVERNLNIEANAVVSEYIRLHTLYFKPSDICRKVLRFADEPRWHTAPHLQRLNRCNSAANCSISLKLAHCDTGGAL